MGGRSSKLANRSNPDVAFTAFNGTRKRTSQATLVGKILLRQAALFPELANTFTEISFDCDRVLHSLLISRYTLYPSTPIQDTLKQGYYQSPQTGWVSRIGLDLVAPLEFGQRP
jgi:hypothetical protein